MLKFFEQQEKINAPINYFPRTPSVLDVREKNKTILRELKEHQNKFRSEKLRDYQNHSFFWFLDNYYLLEEQTNILKRDFPQRYCNQLPRLETGEFKGTPRIYFLIRNFISKSNGKIELGELEDYLKSNQKEYELTTGEIWAIAICLRIGLIEDLIENLKNVELRANESRKADLLTDELFQLISRDYKAEELTILIENHFKNPERYSWTFKTELMTKLRDQDPAFQEIINIFEESAKKQETSLQEQYQEELINQARNQLSISNSINSLRLITKMEWHPFFEKISKVDALFNEDPTNDYIHMDRTTKDAYRKKVEMLSRHGQIQETEVARRCLDLSKKNSFHIGHTLFGEIEKNLIEDLKIKRSKIELMIIDLVKRPAIYYFSLITVFFLLGLSLVVMFLTQSKTSYALSISFGIILLVPLSEFAIGLVNTLVTQIKRPKNLFKIEFKDGVPDEHKTMVVIPCLLVNKKTIDDLVQQLELHYLSNSDNNIYFGLLADPVDHDKEIKNDDDELKEYARKKILNLNGRYKGTDRFFFFNRKRVWNASENKWIAYERKRGKISEFNQLCRGSKITTFINENINWDLLQNLKHIITLDADTQLPINAAKKLIGTIAHPLNRPVYDDSGKKIISGYAIIQPRVSISMVSSIQTRFAQIFSGHTGLDPYTTAVSDVYQDLFGEGNYTGKGLYNIDAFERVLEDIIPDNVILSHDLFEGCIARVGLATDIEVYDDFPENFTIFAKRNHRWTRGDWQLVHWLKPHVRNKKNSLIKNPISFLGRWKIVDNLRRSLVAPTTIIAMSFCWLVAPLDPLISTLMTVLFVNSSIISSIFLDLFKIRNSHLDEHIRNNTYAIKNKIEQIFLMIVYLPEVGLVNCDAIIRANYRNLISKKKTLEWVSFSQIQSAKSDWKDLISFGPLLAFSLFFLIYFVNQEALIVSFPFMATWLLTPYISFGTQRKIPPKYHPLTETEIQEYRRYARLTWHFFEKFATEEENWLAPDNYQEDPTPQIAKRTSPTNIGLQLLSNLSAFDLGFISMTDFLERTEGILKTLQKMEQYKGHFYNWYETTSLKPLYPKYISTVDSGNLAGYLITLKQGSLTLAKEIQEKTFDHYKIGINDTIQIIKEKIDGLKNNKQSSTRKLLNRLNNLSQGLNSLPIQEITQKAQDIFKTSTDIESQEDSELLVNLQYLCQCLVDQCEGFNEDVNLNVIKTRLRLKSIAYQAHELAYKMDFTFLFNQEQMIFSIGMKENEPNQDSSYYDLLASESRLASYFAISKGDIPDEHWFRLSRQMVKNSKSRVLVSWSATMFEYLMPLLIMRRFEDTLLDQTYESIVEGQVDFGNRNKIPWGISESGYNSRDLQHNYQYAAFGIPNVGLKNQSPEDIVVSPYSTMLAAMIAPQASLNNLKKLEGMKTLGPYGFYESIDYGPSRIPKDQNYIILKSVMAHHQGMSLVAINNLINEKIMQNRFHLENRIKSSQILLQEKTPNYAHITKKKIPNINHSDEAYKKVGDPHRILKNEIDQLAESQILSNGRLSLNMNGNGEGYLKLGDVHLGRWRDDRNKNFAGQQIIIKDAKNKVLFSSKKTAEMIPEARLESILSEDKIELVFEQKDFAVETNIIVSSESDVEIRRLTVSNKKATPEEIEILTFQEISLSPPKTYNAHPAFQNLFIKTMYDQETDALIAIRNNHEKKFQRAAFQMLKSEGLKPLSESFETDRSKIISRDSLSSNIFDHESMVNFTNTTGAVLDPVFAIRKKFLIRPNSTCQFYLITGITHQLEDALTLINKYHKARVSERDFSLSWVTAQNTLNHFKIDSEKAITFQKIGSYLFIKNMHKKFEKRKIEENHLTQSDLWSLGISGDIPILTLRIKDEKETKILRELIHAQEYLRLKGHIFDFVIINDEKPSYFQKINDEIQRQIITCGAFHNLNKNGGIFIFAPHIIGEEKLNLIHMISSLIFIGAAGDISAQVSRVDKKYQKHLKIFTHSMSSSNHKVKKEIKSTFPQSTHLEFNNTYGGFENNGATYSIHLQENKKTPAPWLNVICNNPHFGFQITESGLGFTWSINSRQNRISKWNNDPLSKEVSEALFIQDRENGLTWSPMPYPFGDLSEYVVKHEAGKTSFFHDSNNIEQKLLLFCPLNDRVKIFKLVLKNKNQEAKKLDLCFCIDWQLSTPDDVFRPILTTWDESKQILWAKNNYHSSFAEQVSFIASSQKISSVLIDPDFIFPLNAHREKESHTDKKNHIHFEATIPSCGFVRSELILLPFEEKTSIFILGQSDSFHEIENIQEKYLDPKNLLSCLSEVESFWLDILSKIAIETPSKELNILFNHWLLYQTLACRIWARSAFYQSGGAYGFRDQLQDVMAIIFSSPKIAREHIILAAGRQFLDGDVQHWWHPPTGQGIRTKFSDDLLWLPYVVSYYIEITGDEDILKESIPFLESMDIPDGHDEVYFTPKESTIRSSLFDHCLKALVRSLKTGPHDLPLMGSGDWNDGMNKVGHKGFGESVWLSWFLIGTLKKFIPLCDKEGDDFHVKIFNDHIAKIQAATEDHAWDGEWYLRAFYDNGEKLGSKENDECQIDSIAQSWSVLSDSGDKNRAKRAIESAYLRLFDPFNKIIKLFDPPFDKTSQEPGYVKNYLPGVRENGGQYTHAGIWLMMAFAQEGDQEKTWELLQALIPINHSFDEESANKYKLEPYVLAADIYGVEPHIGRGGWSWYTGSSSWLYRAILENFIGFRLRGNKLSFKPCLPRTWDSIKIKYTFGSSHYHITLLQKADKDVSLHINHQLMEKDFIELIDDGRDYEVQLMTPFSTGKE